MSCGGVATETSFRNEWSENMYCLPLDINVTLSGEKPIVAVIPSNIYYLYTNKICSKGTISSPSW